MLLSFDKILSSMLLGVGLAMDAFSVSVVNGMNEPDMPRRKMLLIAGVFALFQIAMPLIGWVLAVRIIAVFSAVKRFVPWIGAGLLFVIGGRMVWEGIRKTEEDITPAVGFGALMIQGIATSIDALSVGLTMTDSTWPQALAEAGIIGVVTFVICILGCIIGRKAGKVINDKATILGGVILIGIGLKILITALVG